PRWGPAGRGPAGRGPAGAGVRPVVGLGQPEAAERLSRGHPREPLLLLLLAAVAPDRVHRERALHGDQRPDSGVGGLELLAGDAVVDARHPGTAVSRQVHAEQTLGAHAADEV